MHNLSSAFVLGYHGCDLAVAEKLLLGTPFNPSENLYDWLGSGIYFWESNPDRALAWAVESAARSREMGGIYTPTVVGAAIDLGFCLDLISTNGITAVGKAYEGYCGFMRQLKKPVAENRGGTDLRLRFLDCEVLNYLHAARKRANLDNFDTVKGVFIEGDEIYAGSGFRAKTHIQICVRNPAMIKGIFRVPAEHFSSFAAPPA